MQKMSHTKSDEIVAGWLSGFETSQGMVNPAGPLYVGGAAAESSLINDEEALLTRCSSCTGSLGSWCC